jgi:hypothetical protein
MHMATHVLNATQTRPEPQISDTLNQAFNQEASDQFNEDFDERVRQHGRMMALFEGSVKRGKVGCDQTLAGPYTRNRSCASLAAR